MTYLAVSPLNDGFYADGTVSPLLGPNRFLMAVDNPSQKDITWGTRNW